MRVTFSFHEVETLIFFLNVNYSLELFKIRDQGGSKGAVSKWMMLWTATCKLTSTNKGATKTRTFFQLNFQLQTGVRAQTAVSWHFIPDHSEFLYYPPIKGSLTQSYASSTAVTNAPAARVARDPRKTQVTWILHRENKQLCLTCRTTEQVTNQLHRTITALFTRPLNSYTLP